MPGTTAPKTGPEATEPGRVGALGPSRAAAPPGAVRTGRPGRPAASSNLERGPREPTCALSMGAPPERTEIDFKKQAPSLTCSAVCEHFWKIREALKPLTFTLRFLRTQALGALDESGTRGPLASMLGWVLVERRSL